MASLRKRGASWYYTFTDAAGARVERKGCADRRVTEELARAAESEVVRIKAGLVDARDLARRDHQARPLSEHFAAYAEHLASKGATPKHVELSTGRARRVVAIIRGARLADIEPPHNVRRSRCTDFEAALARSVEPARLSDLTAERVQKALATLRAEGRSLQTCNHYRTAIKAFSKWCHDTHRTKEDALRGVRGYNAKEDRRHDRRTIALEELQRLIAAAEQGPSVLGVAGAVRALCYRLAVATGLRYSEIASIRPESFDWDAKSVRVAACYTKNGQTAELPLPGELVADLRPYVASLAPGKAPFRLPKDKGAELLQADLTAAGIPYQDDSGLFFDFHSLRCQTATLADAAGVSPRVVQRLMRHSTLELTGRYTRPRAVDIETAASLIPSLKPEPDRPEALTATGTDDSPQHVTIPLAASLPCAGDAPGRSGTLPDVMAGSDDPTSTNEKPLVSKGFDASRRSQTCPCASTGVRTRTGDLRIRRPHVIEQETRDNQGKTSYQRSLTHPAIHDSSPSDPSKGVVDALWEKLSSDAKRRSGQRIPSPEGAPVSSPGREPWDQRERPKNLC
jgi:integrase